MIEQFTELEKNRRTGFRQSIQPIDYTTHPRIRRILRVGFTPHNC